VADETVNEQGSYENFDEFWQAKLLAMCLRGRDFYARHQGIVKAGYFTGQHFRDLYALAEEHYEKYDSGGIDRDVLRDMVAKRMSNVKDADLESYFEVINTLYGYDIGELAKAEAYSSAKVIDFARRQAMTTKLIRAAESVRDGKPLDGIPEEVMQPLTIGADLDTGYDYFGETIPRIYRSYEVSPATVRTGFRGLDRVLGGGLRPGELGLIVGPPGRGKTAVMVNLAVGAMIARKSVLYFILEGDKEDLAVRVDMRLSRVIKDELMQRQAEVKDFVSFFHKTFKSRLVIKQYGTETATVAELDQYLNYLRIAEGWEPDLIIVDYLNICRRSNQREDIYLGRNYAEGKAWAVKIKKPVWSAVQAKMGALTSSVLRPQHIAEATGRIWAISDLIIGLCQTEEEEKEAPPKLRFFVGKNRNREGHQEISVVFDKHRMFLEEVDMGGTSTVREEI